VPTFTRYVGPIAEELLKAIVIVVLVRTHRIGFLVDAAIFGFAVGTGFSMVENAYYLEQRPGRDMATWIVRGFGTALMHGGATALLGVVALALLERESRMRAWVFLPGSLLAIACTPVSTTSCTGRASRRSPCCSCCRCCCISCSSAATRRSANWLGKGFDADAEMLELINSGRVSDSPVGQILSTLKRQFDGPVVADLLCYLRLYTELRCAPRGC
jgi:hypothetical protein